MTRNEFEEEITTWDELIEFCDDNNLRACDCIYDNNDLRSMFRGILNSARGDRGALECIQSILCEVDLQDEFYEVYEEDYTVYIPNFEAFKGEAAEEYNRSVGWDDECVEDSEEWYNEESSPGDIDAHALESIIAG